MANPSSQFECTKGTKIGRVDQFWLPLSVRQDRGWRGTHFGVTGQPLSELSDPFMYSISSSTKITPHSFECAIYSYCIKIGTQHYRHNMSLKVLLY